MGEGSRLTVCRLLPPSFKLVKLINGKLNGLVTLLLPDLGFPEFSTFFRVRGVEANQITANNSAEFLFKFLYKFLGQGPDFCSGLFGRFLVLKRTTVPQSEANSGR